MQITSFDHETWQIADQSSRSAANMTLSKLTFIIFFGVILSFEAKPGPQRAVTDCYKVVPMNDLTIYTFYHLFWNQASRSKVDFEDGTKCGVILYDSAPALPGEPHLVFFDHRYPEKDHNFVIHGNATVKGNTTVNEVKVEIQFPEDKQMTSFYVLGTDYDEWALVYSCHIENTQVKERAWVLSRRNVTTANLTQAMVEVEHAMEKQGPDFKDRFQMTSCIPHTAEPAEWDEEE